MRQEAEAAHRAPAEDPEPDRPTRLSYPDCELRWGLFTTAQAEGVGVTRKQLVHTTSTGVIKRVSHGVYRMAGAPPSAHESIYATWLALGGATTPRTETGVAPLVAGGLTAAVVHEIGDFLPDRLDLIEIGTDTSLLTDALGDAVRRARSSRDSAPSSPQPSLTSTGAASPGCTYAVTSALSSRATTRFDQALRTVRRSGGSEPPPRSGRDRGASRFT